MDKLVEALKQKFKRPQEALLVLGLDSALLEEVSMPKITRPGATATETRMAPAAMVARSALFTYLYPRLAADSKKGFDFTGLVKGVTSKNFEQARPVLVNRVTSATKGKLAQDANIEDLANLLNALKPDAESADQMASMPPGAGAPPMPATAPAPATPTDAEPGDTVAKIKAYLEQEGVSPDILNNLDAFLSSEANGGGAPAPPNGGDNSMMMPGQDENEEMGVRGSEETPLSTDEEEEEENKEATDEVIPGEQEDLMLRNAGGSHGAEDRQLVTRTAMDRAIKLAQDKAVANSRAIREAERFVRPWVGDLAMDASSPADVYRATLKILGVNGHDKMHPDALRPVLEAQQRPSQVARNQQARRLAQDTKVEGSFLDRFPGAKNIRTMQ